MSIQIPLVGNTEKLLYNLIAGGEAIAYESLSVNNSSFTTLTIPNTNDKVVYARVIMEADATTTDPTKAARFIQSPNIGTGKSTITPTNLKAQGFLLADKGTFTISGLGNLKSFKCIGLDAGKTHTLRVEYYG